MRQTVIGVDEKYVSEECARYNITVDFYLLFTDLYYTRLYTFMGFLSVFNIKYNGVATPPVKDISIEKQNSRPE